MRHRARMLRDITAPFEEETESFLRANLAARLNAPANAHAMLPPFDPWFSFTVAADVAAASHAGVSFFLDMV